MAGGATARPEREERRRAAGTVKKTALVAQGLVTQKAAKRRLKVTMAEPE